MGVSINWLKNYVDIDWRAEELAHRLTMAGIAIEGVEQQGEDVILELDLTPESGRLPGNDQPGPGSSCFNRKPS